MAPNLPSAEVAEGKLGAIVHAARALRAKHSQG
jgi:hypothetical protein